MKSDWKYRAVWMAGLPLVLLLAAFSPSKGKVIDPSRAWFHALTLPIWEDSADTQPVVDGPVVLVVVDALNASHMGAYGYPKSTTPHMDFLAQNGLVFSNWISNSSWTRPSYTSLITGEPKSRHQMELTGETLDDEIVTMAEVFKRGGYRTGGFVGNPLANGTFGYGQGFDVYEDAQDHGAFPRGEILINRAMDFLNRDLGSPYFLSIFLTDTHTPYDPVDGHRRYLEEAGAKTHIAYPQKEYGVSLSPVQREGIVAAYDGEVSYVDEQIGRLVRHLKKRADFHKTTIVITADHGELFGSHNCYQHAYHMWQGVLRVPVIIYSPRLKKKGVMDHRPWTHVDMLPSLGDLVHLRYPAQKPGRSIWAWEKRDPHRPRMRVSAYDAKGVFRQAVHYKHFKLVYHRKVNTTLFSRLDGSNSRPEGDRGSDLGDKFPSLSLHGERLELYHMVDDPQETENVYQRYKNTADIRKMRAVLNHPSLAPKRKASTKKKIAPAISEETLEALKAAGYIH